MRKVLAALAACGFILSVVAYIKSLSGTTSDDLRLWVGGLVIGSLALQVPIPFLEHSWSKERKLFWKGLARGMPRWAAACMNLFWLIAIAHLVWFFLRSHAAAPAIKDGQYVLSSHGRIRGTLTGQEYLALKAGELRLYAAFMIACYVTPMFYWWFSRKHADLVSSPPLAS